MVRWIVDLALWVVVIEHEVAIVELHLEYRQRTDVWRLLREHLLMLAQLSVERSYQGLWRRCSHLRAGWELAVYCLPMLHAFVGIGLPLDDLLATGLEGVTEALGAGAEVTVRAVTVQLMVAIFIV